MDDSLAIDRNQQRLVALFQGLDDWQVRYHQLVTMGEALPAFPETWRSAHNRLHGCASRLWLRGLSSGDRVLYRGTSDCPIDAGLLAMVLEVYSGQPAEDVVATTPWFIRAIGLPGRISMVRMTGLEQMVLAVRRHALEVLLASRRPVNPSYRFGTGTGVAGGSHSASDSTSFGSPA